MYKAREREHGKLTSHGEKTRTDVGEEKRRDKMSKKGPKSYINKSQDVTMIQGLRKIH